MADGVGDHRQHPDRPRGAVQVVPAVVGHRYGRHSEVDGPSGIVHPGHALQHERTLPLLSQPGHVVPRRRRGLHPPAIGLEKGGQRLTGPAQVGYGQIGNREGAGELPQPLGPDQHLGPELHGGLELDALGDGRAPPVASVGERPVEGGDEAHRSGGPGPLDPLDHLLFVPDPVGLEEDLRIGRRHLLDRLAGEAAEPHGRPPGGGGPGHRHLAVGVDGLDAGGGDDHRERDRLTHHRGREIAFGRQPGHMGGQAELGERLDVVAGREALLGPGHQGGIDRPGQAPLGPTLGLGHRFEPWVLHCWIPVLVGNRAPSPLTGWWLRRRW